MRIADNIQKVQLRIQEALQKSDNPSKKVDLIAVTKTVPVSRIQEAVSEGITQIGENKVQEILAKFDEIDKQVKWHMIGHLQRNKVKYIIDKVSLIHSVDSISLLQEINGRAESNHAVMQCLLQVNVSGETSKYGVDPSGIDHILQAIEGMQSAKIVGLMTMAPYFDNPEKSRDCFKRLHEIYRELKARELQQVEMEILSMGMSNDFEIAVQEGSTMVRIGSALFGERDYG
jgi:PLP dependent protein